jgi:hypothetical protein
LHVLGVYYEHLARGNLNVLDGGQFLHFSKEGGGEEGERTKPRHGQILKFRFLFTVKTKMAT